MLSSITSEIVVTVNTKAMTSKTWPRRARTNKGAIRGPNRAERGGFISSLALQLEQTKLLHASNLRKNGVAKSCLQTGHVAINQYSTQAYDLLCSPSSSVSMKPQA